MNFVTVKFSFLVILHFLFTTSLVGQVYNEQELDTLIQQAAVCDSAGMESLEQLLIHSFNINDQTSHKYYLELKLKCAKTRGNKLVIANAYYNILNYFYNENNIDSMLLVADKMAALAENDSGWNINRAVIAPIVVIGDFYYFNLDDVETAYSYYDKAINQSYNRKYYDIYLEAIGKRANYYIDNEKFDEAILSINEALAKTPDLNNPKDSSRFKFTFNSNFEYYSDELYYHKNIAVLYDNKRTDEEKIESYYFMKDYMNKYKDENYFALNIIKQLLGSMQNILPIDTLLELGTKGIKLEELLNENDHYINLYHGKNHIKIGKYKEATKFLKIAEAVAKSQPNYYQELAETYDALATTELKLGNPIQARDYFDLYKTYIDSTYIRRNDNAVETVEAKYALSQKEAENLIIKEKANRLSERVTLFSIIGSLLLLSLVLALIFYNQKRKSALKLSQLNETKDKIFAILAHDLRAPISSLSNLASKITFLRKHNRLDELDAIAKQTDTRLSALNENLNNVLLWAITQSNLVEIAPSNVTLRDEINKITEIYSDTLGDKEIIIKNNVPDSSQVYSDVKVLQTLLRNLITNAIKFSYKGGTIEFSAINHNDKVEFRIMDNGVGLKESPHDSETKQLIQQKSKGSGIGLKICKELAKKSGIDLSLIENPKGGAIGIIQFQKAA